MYWQEDVVECTYALRWRRHYSCTCTPSSFITSPSFIPLTYHHFPILHSLYSLTYISSPSFILLTHSSLPLHTFTYPSCNPITYFHFPNFHSPYIPSLPHPSSPYISFLLPPLYNFTCFPLIPLLTFTGHRLPTKITTLSEERNEPSLWGKLIDPLWQKI